MHISSISTARRLLGFQPGVSQPNPATGGEQVIVCRMGPEIREVVLQARRAETSVRHLAVVVGVSRSAMRRHLRDCLPAAYGLTRCDPSGPQTYRSQSVIDALAHLGKRNT